MIVRDLIHLLKQLPMTTKVDIRVMGEDKNYEIEGVDFYCNVPTDSESTASICVISCGSQGVNDA